MTGVIGEKPENHTPLKEIEVSERARERERERERESEIEREIERDVKEGGLSNNIVLFVCWCGA
jgi:hypothetical protein